MSSENPTGADNQQERLDAYIAGFVDGEGSFHVAICRNDGTRAGWQLVPEFHVSQNIERREVLDLIRSRFGCGRIRANHRASADTSLVFVVRKREDLLTRVIPFFETQPLVSSKQRDFLTFARIVRSMAQREHLTADGFAALVTAALSMNGGGRYRRVHGRNASGILRDHTPNTGEKSAVKIWSDLHGDMQSQAEMPWPPTPPRGAGGNNNVGPYPPWA
jgi:LAGLIDADG endonuclease